VPFHQDNAPVDKSIKTTAPYSPDLAPSDFFLFADLKRMLAGKKFSTYEEVNTEAYFEAMSKSYTIKMVSKNCMTAIIVVSLE
jgi:hypothetical protein